MTVHYVNIKKFHLPPTYLTDNPAYQHYIKIYSPNANQDDTTTIDDEETNDQISEKSDDDKPCGHRMCFKGKTIMLYPQIQYVDRPVITYVDRPVITYVDKPVTVFKDKIVTVFKEKIVYINDVNKMTCDKTCQTNVTIEEINKLDYLSSVTSLMYNNDSNEPNLIRESTSTQSDFNDTESSGMPLLESSYDIQPLVKVDFNPSNEIYELNTPSSDLISSEQESYALPPLSREQSPPSSEDNNYRNINTYNWLHGQPPPIKSLSDYVKLMIKPMFRSTPVDKVIKFDENVETNLSPINIVAWENIEQEIIISSPGMSKENCSIPLCQLRDVCHAINDNSPNYSENGERVSSINVNDDDSQYDKSFQPMMTDSGIQFKIWNKRRCTEQFMLQHRLKKLCFSDDNVLMKSLDSAKRTVKIEFSVSRRWSLG